MSALDDLIALVPPPAQVPPVDWGGVVLPGGAAPPADYRALVEAYGPGKFDGFLRVLLPGAANRYDDLLQQTGAQIDALRTLRERGEDVPYDIDTPEGQLVAWGMTDNGDVAYWRRSPGAAPDTWTVAVNESRSPDWFEYDGPVTAFLRDVLSRRVHVDVFPEPEDWPSASPRFEGQGAR
jgi:hypothetical protein